MNNEKEIQEFIKAVRESFPDAAIIYTFGACYGFHKILKKVFKNAIPYTNSKKSHIYSKINGKFYDIFGEYVDSDAKPRGNDLIAVTQTEEEKYWQPLVFGQRVEYMLKKYNE